MRAVFRFRPATKPKTTPNNSKILSLEIDTDSNTAVINKSNGQQLEWNADALFNESSTQQQIFENVGERLIDNTLEGYNTCCFAYGQTGSGKTFTMFGDDQNEGLAFRSLDYLFKSLKQNTSLLTFTCNVSAVEIYNDKIYDRLLPNNSNDDQPLKLINDKIVNLSQVIVESYSNTKQKLHHAINTRTTAQTDMNNTSSRSHLVITLDLFQQMKDGATLTSKLHFIDLAGSERIKKTNARGHRLNEAKSINGSLLVLGRVVDALILKQKNSKSPRTYVPYRDSTLTRLLKTSLGGNSMTTIIGCCAVDNIHLEETASTLHFIARSASIKNKPIRNQRYSTSQINEMQRKFEAYKAEADAIIQIQKEEYEQIIAKLTQENEMLRNQLASTPSIQNKRISADNSEMRKRMAEIENLKMKITSHEEKLNEYQDSIFNIDKLGDKFKTIMFFEAVQKGDLDKVKKMLQYVNIDSVDSNGEGALAFAIKSNKLEIMKYLLDKEADVDITDKDSISALMVAVVYRRYELLKLLCESGANVDYQNTLGCTAIHIAASRGYGGIVDLLLKYTKSINIASKRGWTTLMFAAKAGNVEIVWRLLTHKDKVDIDAVNKAKCSALILAAYSGHEDVVSLLLKHNADHNIRDKFGMSAHIWASKKKYENIVSILKAYGSKLSMRDKLQVML